MDASLIAILGLGFLLGLRHAADADHVAAVSALASQHRNPLRSCVLGAFWGAGHTTALLVAGVAVIGFKVAISPELEQRLEMMVGFVLILLGGHVLLRSLGTWTLHRHEHAHDSHAHNHLHLHLGADRSPGHLHLFQLGGRPFLVGLAHGLAGSASLMLLILPTIPSASAGLLYILIFGGGSTVGMLVVSGLIGIPFAVTAGHSPKLHAGVQALAGAVSVLLGLAMVWELGGS